jgi:DNA polymerase-1
VTALEGYKEAWLCDLEFISRPGERPIPVCLVAWELHSGRRLRLWQEELVSRGRPPFDIGPHSLFVAYFASAELGCFRALGWPMPARILDLFTEFRNATNGLYVPAGNGLVGALTYFGLDAIDAAEKDEMRELVLTGGPWNKDEREAILDYCESDVEALSRLLPVLLPRTHLPHALLRGRYMAAVAQMEWNGVPINLGQLAWLRENWEVIQERLIARFDAEYGIFEDRSFRQARFETWLAHHNIPWPRLESDRLDLEDETFRSMARTYSVVAPIRELRHMLSKMRLNDLAVGTDGRNRCLLSPFQARTSRNQPSSAKYIFGPSVWLRYLITPPPGLGLGYIDWEQQEFGIAAVLSGDPAMLEAYQSGDPYLAFAKQAEAAPSWATKETHGQIRELYKTCILAVNYGMTSKGLAFRIGRPEILARQLLEHHRTIYSRFWSWQDNAVNHAVLNGWQQTVFGWVNRVPVGGCGPRKRKEDRESFNPRSLGNFHAQGNAAEMLRLACCLATENGVEVSGPVHDAVLICAPLDRLEDDVERMRGYMAEASRIVLGGFELRTDARLIRYPDHYSDPRGVETWREISSLLCETMAT